MKSNIVLPQGVNLKPFLQEITDHLGNNLDAGICNNLASLLAIDYANRLHSKPLLTTYIETCVERLKKHLGPRVILKDNFSASMTLFAVAITPEKKDEAIDHSKAKEQLHDTLIEEGIQSIFGELNVEENEAAKALVKTLINGEDGQQVMDFIMSNPKMFHSIVVNAIQSKKQKEALEFAQNNISRLMQQSQKLGKKIDNIKNNVTKILFAGSLLAASSIGLVIGGFALPVLLIPTMAASLKYAPVIGDKLSDKIINNNGAAKAIIKEINAIKNEAIGSEKQNVKVKDKAVAKTLSKEQIKSIIKTEKLSQTKAKSDNQGAIKAFRKKAQEKTKSTSRGV